MDTDATIEEARMKLKKRFEDVKRHKDRPGGIRRKKQPDSSISHSHIRNDDRVIHASLKRFGLSPMHGVDEVCFDVGGETQIRIKSPKVEASIGACVYVVSRVK